MSWLVVAHAVLRSGDLQLTRPRPIAMACSEAETAPLIIFQALLGSRARLSRYLRPGVEAGNEVLNLAQQRVNCRNNLLRPDRLLPPSIKCPLLRDLTPFRPFLSWMVSE